MPGKCIPANKYPKIFFYYLSIKNYSTVHFSLQKLDNIPIEQELFLKITLCRLFLYRKYSKVYLKLYNIFSFIYN